MASKFKAVYPWMLDFNFKTPEELYVYAAIFGITEYTGGTGFIGSLKYFYNFVGFNETGKTVEELKSTISALQEDGVIEVYTANSSANCQSYQFVATVGEFTYNKEDWTLQ